MNTKLNRLNTYNHQMPLPVNWFRIDQQSPIPLLDDFSYQLDLKFLLPVYISNKQSQDVICCWNFLCIKPIIHTSWSCCSDEDLIYVVIAKLNCSPSNPLWKMQHGYICYILFEAPSSIYSNTTFVVVLTFYQLTVAKLRNYSHIPC